MIQAFQGRLSVAAAAARITHDMNVQLKRYREILG
jgi:hypothetical protein